MITKQFKLSIELVPSTIWYVNLYNHYKNNNQMEKWHQLKQYLFEIERKHCWVCKKEERNLEAHEFWEYDDYKHIQKLWLHSIDGDKMLHQQRIKKEDIIDHFCKVNICSVADFKKYEERAFVQWEQRSKFQWKQDLGIYHPKFGLKELKSQQRLVN